MRFTGTIATVKPLIIPIFIPHQGCPHQCAFCNQHIITGARLPENATIEETVHQYLAWAGKKHKDKELSFYGGSFTALDRSEMEHYASIGRHYIETGLITRLRCSTRPDAITPEIARWLKTHFFHTVELGVQSFSDSLLQAMKRGHSSAAAVFAAEHLKNEGLSSVMQFMTGFPGETENDLDITMEMLGAVMPDAIRIYPFIPVPGTDIAVSLAENKLATIATEIIINRTARLFLAAQKLGIPSIRIGLPREEGIPDIYPHNLAQVVIATGLSILKEDGVTEFLLPESWETSARMAKITASYF